MTTEPSAEHLRRMLDLRERRERHAQAELERSRELETAALVAAEHAASALTRQAVLRRVHESQIYRDMRGCALSARDVERVNGRLFRLQTDFALRVAEADAAMQAARAAREATDTMRRRLHDAHRGRRKWEELCIRAATSADARSAVVEELSVSDITRSGSLP